MLELLELKKKKKTRKKKNLQTKPKQNNKRNMERQIYEGIETVAIYRIVRVPNLYRAFIVNLTIYRKIT